MVLSGLFADPLGRAFKMSDLPEHEGLHHQPLGDAALDLCHLGSILARLSRMADQLTDDLARDPLPEVSFCASGHVCLLPVLDA